MWWVLLLTTVAGFTVSTASGQTLPDPPRDRAYLTSNGNELMVLRNAPVPYRTLEALNAAVERPFPASSRVIRLVRAAPPQVIDYAVCVTADGTLILGEQVFAVDAARSGNTFVRGEITRGYAPLDRPGPWVWLLELPVGREMNATLVVRATTAGWPVRTVVIDVRREP
jgi:hypothetical protein